MTRLSIIIPVYNDFAALKKCLRALQSQLDSYNGLVECIVVDNGSTDDIHEIVQDFPRVSALTEATPGSYAARNTGARSAAGEYLAFTDSDCIPTEDWVEAILRITTVYPAIDVHIGEVRLFPDHDSSKEVDLRVAAYEIATAFRQEYYANTVHFGPTANLIVRKPTFEALRGFDQSLMSGGDKDFGQRAWRAGFQLRYSPECVVAHPTRSSLGQLESKIRRIVGGDFTKAGARAKQTAADWARYLILRPGNSLRLIWSRPGLSVYERLAASEVAFRVIGWQVAERLKLRSGGQVRR